MVDDGPEIIIEQAARRRAATPGHWLITWRIENRDGTLRIVSGRLPHGRFRCGETEPTPAVTLGPRESAKLDFTVRCDEAPGTVVENAFLILRVIWSEAPWLILIRLRVSIDENGAPEAGTELITAQAVGFSATMN